SGQPGTLVIAKRWLKRLESQELETRRPSSQSGPAAARSQRLQLASRQTSSESRRAHGLLARNGPAATASPATSRSPRGALRRTRTSRRTVLRFRQTLPLAAAD